MDRTKAARAMGEAKTPAKAAAARENGKKGGRPLEFDPHQYAIDCGWDFTAIEATAAQGVSETDAAQLTRYQTRALLRWCREQVRLAK